MTKDTASEIALRPHEARRIAQWLRDRCGLHFMDAKLDMLAQRLTRVLDQHRLPDLPALMRAVESGGDQNLLEAVVGAAATNHTYFNREEGALGYLRDAILPERRGEATRIWSAAASTGDEAYTCAMIAAEALGRGDAAANVALLGTDISVDVLQVAETGEFSKPHLEHISADWLKKYFLQIDAQRYRVAPDIRAMCMFRRLNLIALPFPFRQRFHVVFCRNVLYYFDLPTQRRVIEAIYDVTEPGGYLLVSAADHLRGMNTRWVPVHSCVYRRLA